MAKRSKSIHATEKQEQQSFVSWCKIQPIPFPHSELVPCPSARLNEHLVMIPNESLVSLITAQLNRIKYLQMLVTMGFRKGASDMFLAVPIGRHHGLWIEMKRTRAAFKSENEANKAISDEQIDFANDQIRLGYAVIFPYGWIEAVQLVEQYLAGNYVGEVTAAAQPDPVQPIVCTNVRDGQRPEDGCCSWCLYDSGAAVINMPRMIVCPNCGNKRCPKATNHRLLCTNSNEPGQLGSSY